MLSPETTLFVASCLVAFPCSLLGTMVFTPVVRHLAFRFNILDVPDSRKVHTRLIPRMGGVAVYAGIALSVCLSNALLPQVRELVSRNLAQFVWLSVGATLLCAVGLVDDIRGLKARTKLLFQLGASILAYFGGFRFEFFHGASSVSTIWTVLGFFATLFWITATTNAVNLIDGLDGLASGITSIALTILAVIAYANGHVETALLAIVIAGGTLGFLYHNAHPAKIFLGDSGSLLLGYLLAALSIKGTQQGSVFASLVGPLCLLYVPLLDTGLAIWRRSLKGVPIFFPDAHHIHHRLLQRGLAHPQVVVILWGVTLAVGGTALALNFLRASLHAVVVNILATALLFVVLRFLGFLEVHSFLHSLSIINRRRHTPRQQMVVVRKLLGRLAKAKEQTGIAQILTELADQINLDSLSVVVDSGDPEFDGEPFFAWQRALDGVHEDHPPHELAYVEARETSPDSSLTVAVVFGKQQWKLRRRSEESLVWAKLLATRIATLPGFANRSRSGGSRAGQPTPTASNIAMAE